MLTNRLIIFIMVLLTASNLSAMGSNGNQAIELSDTTIVTQSQDELISRNLFFELLGTSSIVGVGYDQRFKPNSPFGFRAGLSFISGSVNDCGWFTFDWDTYTRADYEGATFPLELNAILGRRASKFELGIGAIPCILRRCETKHWSWYSESVKKNGVRLNIFGTINIGYRLQRKTGFFLRTGFSFIFGDFKCSPFDGLRLLPYLALGYTIR